MINYIERFDIDKKTVDFVNMMEATIKDQFSHIEEVFEYNQLKVLNAMQEAKIDVSCFNTSTGYGYNDFGRDKLEEVYSKVFHTEAALVRPQIVCGTHALYLAIAGNTRPGDEILAPAGGPYDTLEEVIGIRESRGSLAEYGITYKQVDLKEDGGFDFENIKKSINEKTKMCIIQRSKGYMVRPTFSVKQIGELIDYIKGINDKIIFMVDNCYGEFTDFIEPSDVGAHMTVGSLIKNPGGGLASSGGYIVGTEECIENAAVRLNAPGLGREVGASLGLNPLLFQGFFMAPQVTSSALKGAILLAAVFEKLGYVTVPHSTEKRYDIIQAIELKTREAVIAFCEGIQAAAPIDSFVTPIPSYMPGYSEDVIMAAGTFIQGSSIELSADAPMREPFAVYFQGGLTYPHAKLGVMKALQSLVNKGVIEL